MINRIKQYKRMIGDAIRTIIQTKELALKNNELATQNTELTKKNNDLTNKIIDLVFQNNDLTSQINDLIRINYELIRHNNELGIQNNDLIRHNTFLTNSVKEELELKIELQNEIAAINSAAFAGYKNLHAGKDIVVLGAGPTLNKYMPLKDVIHIGVNRVCTEKRIPLDYFFMQDFGLYTNKPRITYEKEIEKLKCKIFFGLFMLRNANIECSESFCEKIKATRYYADFTPSKIIYTDIRFHPLMDFASVVFPALHFALFTNPKKIYLVGCDASYGGYFTKEKQVDSIKEKRFYTNFVLTGYRKVKEFAEMWYPDTEIISINPVNLKGLFRDMITNENGELVDCPDTGEIRDFSDNAIKDFIDRHIETVLFEQIHKELSCKVCGKKNFTVMRGLSDETPENIEIKCNNCNINFLYP